MRTLIIGTAATGCVAAAFAWLPFAPVATPAHISITTPTATAAAIRILCIRRPSQVAACASICRALFPQQPCVAQHQNTEADDLHEQMFVAVGQRARTSTCVSRRRNA